MSITVTRHEPPPVAYADTRTELERVNAELGHYNP